MMDVRILFLEKQATNEDHVANVDVDQLLRQSPDKVSLIRVTQIDENFDRALVHLASKQCEENNWLAAIRHPVVALRVTTQTGVPIDQPHVHLTDPCRVMLGVRRMPVLADAESWKAFLLASVDDCIAVVEGRWQDLREAARPMLRLFLEDEEVLPAIRILCLGVEEAHRQVSHGSRVANQIENASRQACWWRRVLDNVVVQDDRGQDVLWKDALRDSKKGVDALMRRVQLEARCTDAPAFEDIQTLIQAIVEDKTIAEPMVKSADDAALKLFG